MEALKLLYENALGSKVGSIERLSGAGSNRQYFRIISAEGESMIGCIGTSREENDAFLYLSAHFLEKGLPVPEMFAVSDDHIRYIQSDLGDISLFSLVKQGDYSLLEATIRALVKIQTDGADGLDFSVCYPQSAFDRENIMFDLNYFKYCFLKPTGVDFHEVRLQMDFYHLAERLLDYSIMRDKEGRAVETFMYRDFQSRNVMIYDSRCVQDKSRCAKRESEGCEAQPFFIDYQGGRRGPIYYDLASFLWQASAGYDEETRERLIGVYYVEMSKRLSLPSEDEFMQRLHLFVFFRILQVLGAYGYRGYFERKKHFLDSIAPALSNLKQFLTEGIADDFPELLRVLMNLCEPEFSQLTTHDSQHPVGRARNTKRELEGCKAQLTVRIFSFSYKKGIPEDESGNGGGYVFDCRSTHNPGRYEQYKHLTGLDDEVIRFLEDDGEITDFLASVYRLADHHVERYLERGFTDLMFSFGCTGGQHRSVYCAQHLAEHLYEKYSVEIHLCHREQDITQTLCRQ